MSVIDPLVSIAQAFSPRYEQTRGDLVTIDLSGLGRLLGPPAAIGAELAREAAARGARVHIALAATRTAAMVVALSRPGVIVVEAGAEAATLAPLPVDILEQIIGSVGVGAELARPAATDAQGRSKLRPYDDPVPALKRWGVRTLGELAALPPADLVSRLGRPALMWQAIARGEDIRPLVPALPEERFESTLDLDWPIEGLEPLSFVLTRLLEPLSTRLERRDRGAAVLHVVLRLVTHEVHTRRLQLPAPMRDVRTLRTLALLDLESHPPAAAIDRVTVVIDPTPGRVLQHTLFARARPTPERLSTVLARLGALMGQDRLGAAALVDSYRPGAFAMTPFKTEHESSAGSPTSCSGYARGLRPERVRPGGGAPGQVKEVDRGASNYQAGGGGVLSVLRRCRPAVPARVVTDRDRPVRVTTDRGGFAGGSVTCAVGPWRTSGNWWAAGKSEVGSLKSEDARRQTSDFRLQTSSWNRDEWDVSLSDGGVYRIFRDREADTWFIDGIVD